MNEAENSAHNPDIYGDHMTTEAPMDYNGTTIHVNDVIVSVPAVMYTLIALQLAAIVCAVIGNGFLVIMILKEWKRARRQVTAYFILNLAICDLFSSAVHQPMRLVDIVFNETVVRNADLYCKITGFFAAFVSGVAFHSIVMISIDRYVLICHPMRAKIILTARRAKIILSIIWISTCGFMIPLPILFTCVIHMRLNGERNTSFCLIDVVSDKINFFFYTACLFYYVIPLCTITVCYSRVFYVLYRGASKVIGKDANSLRMLRTRKAVARIMLFIAVLFVLCESPYFIAFFYRSLGYSIKNNPVTILLIIECLPLICAVTNPIVYGSHSMCNKKRFSALLGSREQSRTDRKGTYRSDATLTVSLKGTPVVARPQVIVHSCNGLDDRESTDV